jgi:hypothetical protein
MQEVFWHAAGDLVGDDEPSAVLVAGMPVDAADGMLVNVADTPQNRAYFGTTGTGDGSSPFPQVRIVALTARAGRAIRGAVLGTARDGEQTLLKVLTAEQPGLFAGRVVLFDRNFPGHDVILSVLLAGGHVIARARGGIALPFQDTPDKGWLGDGSRVSWLNAPSGKKEDRLPVRVAEHSALVTGPGGEEASETCTLITTLLDEQAVPAGALRDAYPSRWTASETTFGENKATITGAGNRTSGPVFRSGSPQLVEQEAWVRHEAHCRIARAAGRNERSISGSDDLTGTRKGARENSMSVNRRACPGAWGVAPGDPRDTAKVRLPES